MVLKVKTNVPALFVVITPMSVPDTVRFPFSVRVARFPVDENVSSLFAVPVRSKVSVAP
ncbi:MAG: hypothetical protein FAF03_02765 [Epsilonproteobacteria bacterium]|nr:hypothetical protein [Campylobacterota bacterium]